MSAKAKKEGKSANTYDFLDELKRALGLSLSANETDVFVEIGRLKGKAGEERKSETTVTWTGDASGGGIISDNW
jgi:hypothetical protein